MRAIEISGKATQITPTVSITNRIFVGYGKNTKGTYIQVRINKNKLMLAVEDFKETKTRNQAFKAIIAKGGEDIRLQKTEFLEVLASLKAKAEANPDKYADVIDEEGCQGRVYDSHGWNITPDGLKYFDAGIEHDKYAFAGSNFAKLEAAGDKEAYLESVRQVLLNNPNVRKHMGFAAAGFIRGLIPGIEANPVWLLQVPTGGGRTVLANWISSMMHSPEDARNTDSQYSLSVNLHRVQCANHSHFILDEVQQYGARNGGFEHLIYNITSGESHGRMVKNPITGAYVSVADKPALLTAQLLLDNRPLELSEGLANRAKVFDYRRNELWPDMSIASTENYGWLAPMLIEDIQKNLAAYQDFYKSVRKQVFTAGEALAILGELILAKVLDIRFGG